MKYSLLIVFFFSFFLLSCQRQAKHLDLILYQPLPSNYLFLGDANYFQDIHNLGFNSIFLIANDHQRGTLTQAIALAHAANLQVILELPSDDNLQQAIDLWVGEHQVDGFVVNSTDHLSDKQRRVIHHAILKAARAQERAKSAFGKAGIFIGRSQIEAELSFVEATFGQNGRRSSLRNFLNTAAAPRLEIALLPQEHTANQLALYHSLRTLYGRRAQAITMLPSSLASNSTKSAPLLAIMGSSPQSFLYPAMLAPQDDYFLQANFPQVIELRQNNQALQHGQIHLLSGSHNLYADVVTLRSQQIVRIANFDNTPTIFNLTNVRTIVRGKKLTDLATNEVIESTPRGFRVNMQPQEVRFFVVS